MAASVYIATGPSKVLELQLTVTPDSPVHSLRRIPHLLSFLIPRIVF